MRAKPRVDHAAAARRCLEQARLPAHERGDLHDVEHLRRGAHLGGGVHVGEHGAAHARLYARERL
jgi:hypothetical protein